MRKSHFTPPNFCSSDVLTHFRLSNGLCHLCGTRIYVLHGSESERTFTPLTVSGAVKEGRCLFCYPDASINQEADATAGLAPEHVCSQRVSDKCRDVVHSRDPCSPEDEEGREMSFERNRKRSRLSVSSAQSNVQLSDHSMDRTRHVDETAAVDRKDDGSDVLAETRTLPSKSTREKITLRDMSGHKYTGYVLEGKATKGTGVFSRVETVGAFAGNVCIYEGEFENRVFHGKGLHRNEAGCMYEGEFRNGAPNGHGKCVWPTGWSYEGNWKDDMRDGKGVGKQEKENGEVYVGEWKDDVWHGYGELTFAEGGLYSGGFRNGKIHGNGTYIFSDGSTYKGSFKNDIRCGQGEMDYKDGTRYIGEWKRNWREGKGTLYFPDGRVCKGTFKADEFDEGVVELADGISRPVRNGRILDRL